MSAKTFSNDSIARNNGSYQRRLAESLRETLGRAGAISACQAYGWDGVIRYLMAAEAEAA